MTGELAPLNDFESKPAGAWREEVSVKDVLASRAAELALPSAAAVHEDWSGFQPLLFSRDEVPMLAYFSAKERVADYAEMTPYCLTIKGRELLRRMPAGHGLVVNPGQRIGFDVSPEDIAQIRRRPRPTRTVARSCPMA